MRTRERKSAPVVAHIVHRLAVGGLENGLVNLINHMPPARYRHVIICLTESTAFRCRIKSQEVPTIELHKDSGKDLGIHLRLFRVLRDLQPEIVHTRNLPALEFQLTAAMAGVRGRIHGEHGRDVYDLDGTNFKYNLLRKAIRPLIQRYTAVSVDLAQWLINTIGVNSDRLTQIYNGVDIEKFEPRGIIRPIVGPDGFLDSNSFVVGTVGRMEEVKDQLTLVRAFIRLIHSSRDARKRLRLIVIGEGSLRQRAIELLKNAHAEPLAWLPGERQNVPELMRAMDLFVLPSFREGVSNTILEAMATGLSVVATYVGGNPEIVEPGVTGTLVPHSNAVMMAEAVRSYFDNPAKATAHGQAARQRVIKHFTIDAMVAGYLQTYDAVLKDRQVCLQCDFPRADGNLPG